MKYGSVRSATNLALLVLIGWFLTSWRHADAQVFFAGQAAERDFIAMFAFNGRSETDVKNQMRMLSGIQVDLVAKIGELDEQQTDKLQAATESDIRRFFREVDQVRHQLDEMKLGPNDINEAWQVVSPIQVRMNAGIFGEQSLFQRVIKSVLTPDQQTAYQDELVRQRVRRWNIITRMNIAEIERNSMPLTSSQRDQLLAVLEKVELPATLNKQMDGYAGYIRLTGSAKHDQQLKKFLTPAQMKVIDQYRLRYEGWLGQVVP
ncbi:hypothetical protein [Stieleria varia]|uniref:Uncharacterized protein n=1 Tax=Stieleria varia TaxID=2528005 RepID=A0A5C6AMY7_9BACT|nr:hypothetical protein [Stieleria varia]TWU00771.1 hypothetical protein Pla52n_41400 [Stieleria varia]